MNTVSSPSRTSDPQTLTWDRQDKEPVSLGPGCHTYLVPVSLSFSTSNSILSGVPSDECDGPPGPSEPKWTKREAQTEKNSRVPSVGSRRCLRSRRLYLSIWWTDGGTSVLQSGRRDRSLVDLSFQPRRRRNVPFEPVQWLEEILSQSGRHYCGYHYTNPLICFTLYTFMIHVTYYTPFVTSSTMWVDLSTTSSHESRSDGPMFRVETRDRRYSDPRPMSWRDTKS